MNFNFLYIILLINLVSCGGDKVKDAPSIPDSYVLQTQAVLRGLHSQNNDTSAYYYSKVFDDMEFYLDDEPTDITRLDSFITQGNAKFAYNGSSLSPRKVDVKNLVTGEIVQRYNRIKNLKVFSKEYFENHTINSLDVLDISVDHNSVMFLNVMSQRTGDMHVYLYDIETGMWLNSFATKEFDGSYYIGNRADTTRLDNIRCIARIGDHFCIKEFQYEDIRI